MESAEFRFVLNIGEICCFGFYDYTDFTIMLIVIMIINLEQIQLIRGRMFFHMRYDRADWRNIAAKATS
jgi:hypothetical protein